MLDNKPLAVSQICWVSFCFHKNYVYHNLADSLYFSNSLLVTEDFFKSGLPGKQIVDNHRNVESIIALALDSREEVDRRTELAFAAGATPVSEPSDSGFIYSRNFQDLDGHVWVFNHLDFASAAGADEQGE